MSVDAQISTEKLAATKLLIATPMYGGNCTGRHQNSRLHLQKRLVDANVSHTFWWNEHESLVPRARNKVASELLANDFTHLLSIDADVSFTADDILFMLALEKDMIGAPYAKKALDWKLIRDVAVRHPEIDPAHLALVGISPVFTALTAGVFRLDEPQRVVEIGTGMLLTARSVFERMAADYPELEYQPMRGEGKLRIWDFFGTGKFGDNPHYLSEDYYFEARWREMGGEIWVCPWMVTEHQGSYSYRCDLGLAAQYRESI